MRLLTLHTFDLLQTKIFSITTQLRSFKLAKNIRPSKESYLIQRASEEDAEDVLNLMWKAYHPHEPTTAALGLGNKRNYIFDTEAMAKLESGFSLIAKSKRNGQVLGAALNHISYPGDPQTSANIASDFDDPQMRKLYMFYAYVMDYPKLWDKYNTNKVFEIANLFVSPQMRNKGLGMRLTEASIALASEMKYKVIRVDATSPYTSMICKKLNMKLVDQIPFCDYVDDKGQPIFNMPAEVRFLQIYVLLPNTKQLSKSREADEE